MLLCCIKALLLSTVWFFVVQATYTVSLLTKMKQLYSPFVIKKTTGLLASMDKESLPVRDFYKYLHELLQ